MIRYTLVWSQPFVASAAWMQRRRRSTVLSSDHFLLRRTTNTYYRPESSRHIGKEKEDAKNVNDSKARARIYHSVFSGILPEGQTIYDARPARKFKLLRSLHPWLLSASLQLLPVATIQ